MSQGDFPEPVIGTRPVRGKRQCLRVWLILGCTAVLPASWSVPAAAQSETVASRGDIVVTARKREESILKVPVVVTATGSG